MPKTFSVTERRYIDVPAVIGEAAMPDAFKRDAELSKAAAESLMRSCDALRAECEQLRQSLASANAAHATAMAEAHRQHAEALSGAHAAHASVVQPAPVIHVPAPVINVPAPVMHAQPSYGFDVTVTRRDGYGRLETLIIIPRT